MKSIKIIFAGDASIEGESLSIDNELTDILKKYDIVSCNYEGPLFKEDQFPIKKIGPSLSQDGKSIDILKNIGFNFFNLSNNHIMDFGENSLRYTLNHFKDVNYLGAGLSFEDTYRGKVIEINKIKIGFLSLAEWGFGALDEFRNNGYAWINHPCVNELIKNIKRETDFLIIQVHAGIENIEIPLPEWKQRYHEMVDLGADIIIGHHPHIPQGWETYQGKHIFYSLGNFFMQKSDLSQNRSFLLSISLDLTGNLSFEIIPIIRTGNIISLYKDKSFMEYLISLSEMVLAKDYTKKINDLSKQLWQERYLDFYASATNSISKGVSYNSKLKSLKRLVFGKGFDKDMILHNIGIESHRYIVERYLKLRWMENEEI
jgi:hypothetical protein